MRDAGLSGPAVSAATKHVDAAGRGISPATVGNLSGRGRTARDVCELRSAWLMAEALNKPLQELFAMPSVSTDTVERSTPHADQEQALPHPDDQPAAGD